MKRIIILTVSLCLVGALALTTILMAVIPVGKVVNIAMPDAKVYVSTSKTKDLQPYGCLTLRGKDAANQNDQETIENIWKAFQESSKQKALTALFNGNLAEGIKFETLTTSKTFNRKQTAENKAKVVFEYSEAQEIPEVEGKTYKLIYFEIEDLDERTELVVYLGDWNYSNDITVRHSYTMNGNFADLYDLLINLKTPA